MTRGKGVRPFGEHVDDDLVPVYFAEITSMNVANAGAPIRDYRGLGTVNPFATP